MNQGWIKLHRKSLDHWLYKENRPHTKREAWEDMLLLCNHSDEKILIGNQIIDCKRGQSVKSLKTWADTFNWTISKVRRFFILLKKENMIELESVQKSTRLTICNYEYYQSERNNNETQTKRKRNDSETQTATNKNDKNVKNEKNNIVTEVSEKFEIFRKRFPGNKRGLKTELDNFLKKNKSETVNLLLPALEKEISHKKRLDELNLFCPQWKNLQTWINNRCWEQELSEVISTNKSTKNGKKAINKGESRRPATADQHASDRGFGNG